MEDRRRGGLIVRGTAPKAHGCSPPSFRWSTLVHNERGRSGYQVVNGAGCGRRRGGRCGGVVRARECTGAGARRVWLDRAPYPLTVDGLIYASSMVMLDSARRGVRVPELARWLLGLGIVATLAANVAHGLGHGLMGAALCAWSAVALVGSYELLMMLIRNGQIPAVTPSEHDNGFAADPLRRARRRHVRG